MMRFWNQSGISLLTSAAQPELRWCNPLFFVPSRSVAADLWTSCRLEYCIYWRYFQANKKKPCLLKFKIECKKKSKKCIYFIMHIVWSGQVDCWDFWRSVIDQIRLFQSVLWKLKLDWNLSRMFDICSSKRKPDWNHHLSKCWRWMAISFLAMVEQLPA